MKKLSETSAAAVSNTAFALIRDMEPREAGKGVNVGETFRKNMERTNVRAYS